MQVRFSGFGDASDAPAMNAVVAQLLNDLFAAQAARASSFLLVSGQSVDDALSSYQNQINYLQGPGYQAVMSGQLQFSTGNTWTPGWLETAQGIEDGLASTAGVVSRTDLTSLAASFAHNLPTPTGGPNIIPWWWWALGATALVGWALSQGRGLVQATNTARGLHGFRRRRRMRR